MDVSRIDAYRPQIYDWRNMTAREIIKHKDDGDKVPAMYLQWARDFLNSIQADDVTTYEIATSGRTKTQQNLQKENETLQAESATEQDSEVGDEQQPPQLSKAQQDRQEMQNNGTSLRKQAKYFRKQSRELTSKSLLPAYFMLPSLKNASKTELAKLAFAIVVLDANMENVFTNLKNIAVLNEVNNSEDNNDSIVQRAYEQGKELDKIAQNGHSSVDKTEAKMDTIGANMAGYTPTFDDSIDYGEQTISIGNELDGAGPAISFKTSVITSGDGAKKMGSKGLNSEADAQSSNNDNLDKSNEFHNQITDKSGTEPSQPKKEYKRDKKGVSQADKSLKDVDTKQKEDIKKEDKDLPTDRETLVKLEDEDKSAKGDFVKNASKMTTVQDAPSKKEFADDDQKIQTANEFERAKENDGADERTVTMALRADSITADNAAVQNIGQAQTISQMSQNAYNELDQNIQDLMNEINSTQDQIKNEISRVNSGLGGDGISRINQLNAELREYGISAQSMVGGAEGVINSYAGDLDNIGDSFSDALSKGFAAVAGGEAIIANSEDRWLAFKLVNEIIGKNAINVGSRTEQDGIKGIADKSKASSTVNSNLLNITSMKSEIQSKTGVEGNSARARNNNNENQNEEAKIGIIPKEETAQDIEKPNLEKPKEKVKDSEKAVKIAQNDGTDRDDKQNTDINAIIARKVRRGEINMG